MPHILLIEDDPGIRRGLLTALQTNGFDALAVATLAEGSRALEKASFDLMLLDVGLPDGNGIAFCAELRERGVSLPILFLTASVEVDSAVEGLKAGAQDYIRKPFEQRELVAKIRNYVRQSEKQHAFEGLVLTAAQSRAAFQGKDIAVGRKEFAILALLVRHAGETVSRDRIAQAIGDGAEIEDRTIDSHMSHLRRKLRDAGAPLKISNHYGIGYRLEKAP